MQRVNRDLPGMRTLSTLWPSIREKRNFLDPSTEVSIFLAVRELMKATRRSVSRKDWDRSVISSKLVFPFW
jgi:hypothetical protein